MSQEDQILEHLVLGNEITPIDALQKFGCFRLGARIWDLKQKGFQIESKLKNDEVTGKHYSVYFIPKEKQLSLKF